MEIDNLFGLPAHPLLVHAPIVLVPLCLVAAVLMAVKPEWRRRFAVPTAVVAVVAAVSVQLAEGSGEALEERVRETNLVEQHAEIAELAKAEPDFAAVGAVGDAAQASQQALRYLNQMLDEKLRRLLGVRYR